VGKHFPECNEVFRRGHYPSTNDAFIFNLTISKKSADVRSSVSERYRGEPACNGNIKLSQANSLWNERDSGVWESCAFPLIIDLFQLCPPRDVDAARQRNLGSSMRRVQFTRMQARATLEATPSQHQIMNHMGNGSPVQLVRNDIEIVSRIMPEQGQLERLGSIRNCQRSAGSRRILMIAD
jgi:hypothetical protein